MKSNLLRTFFEWALITSVLMSPLFLAWYIFKSREAIDYNTRIAKAQVRLQNARNFMTLLNAECQTYARTNAEFAKFLATSFAAPAPAPAAPTKGGK